MINISSLVEALKQNKIFWRRMKKTAQLGDDLTREQYCDGRVDTATWTEDLIEAMEQLSSTQEQLQQLM